MNGVIDGTDLVYREYYDISIAVATPKGLVVPVLRNVEDLDFAGVERVRCTAGSAADTAFPCSSGTCRARTALAQWGSSDACSHHRRSCAASCVLWLLCVHTDPDRATIGVRPLTSTAARI